MLEADVDSEIQAVLMGARRMTELFARFGQDVVEACFQAILDKTKSIFLNELFPKIENGEYYWEDYVEHDAFTDPKLHKIALKITIKLSNELTSGFPGIISTEVYGQFA